MYVPWEKTPDETFLTPEVQTLLADRDRHKEIDERHNLQRLDVLKGVQAFVCR